jgi:iron(III) transport system ATP-binding protein
MKCIVKNVDVQIGLDPIFSLNNISFTLNGGEILAIVGESGSGKTSLLNVLSGFIPIQHGVVIIDNKTVSCASFSLPPIERNIGYIFQDQNLLPYLSLFENLTLGMNKKEKAARKKELFLLMRDLHLDKILHRYPHEVSGGQQQRIALGRALINNKKLLLFDEPFTGLDKNRMATLAESIRHLIKKYQKIGILVTHQIDEAFLIADKIAFLEEGSIKQVDTVENMYHKPQTIHIAKMLGPVNVIDGKFLKDHKVQTLFGKVNSVALMSEISLNQSVHILTRPDDYKIQVTAKGDFVVTNVLFLGMQKKITVSNGHLDINVHVDHHCLVKKR